MTGVDYKLAGTDIFKPIKIGRTQLRHRLFFPPLTRNRSDADYLPSKDNITYFEQRSRRPGTLIITDATIVSEQAGGKNNRYGLFNDAQEQRWREIAQAVHKNNSFIFIQLFGIGGKADPQWLKERGLKFVSATDNVYINEETKKAAIAANNLVHGLTQEEIKSFIEDSVASAKRAIAAGADGIEYHGAHGSIAYQFLFTSINKREDQYGGSIENRARFLLETLFAIAEAIGWDRVAVRLSPFFRFDEDSRNPYEPSTLAVHAYILGELEQRRLKNEGLAYISITEPRDVTEFKADEYETTEFAFSIWNGVIARAGGYGISPGKAREHVARHPNTIIGYGRYFTSNPDLVDRLEKNETLTPYDRDTFYSGGSKGFIDFPTFNGTL